MFKVYDINVKIVTVRDIKGIEVQSVISSAIDFSFNLSSNMKSFHREQKYKDYSFTSLKPFSREGIYNKGSILSFNIRTPREELKEHFVKSLPGLETKDLVCIVTTVNVIAKYKIDTLETLSPLVMKTEVGYWGTNYDYEYFLDRVNSSAISKYNVFTGKNIPQGTEIFSNVVFKKNRVKRRYKDIVLIGDHCSLKVNDSELAQDIAYFSIGAGLCDMVPRGFCSLNYQYKKRGEIGA